MNINGAILRRFSTNMIKQAALCLQREGGGGLSTYVVIMYSKPSSNSDLSNADSIIHVKINANNYLANAENFIVRGLLNTL
jgi:hypothetical protein